MASFGSSYKIDTLEIRNEHSISSDFNMDKGRICVNVDGNQSIPNNSLETNDPSQDLIPNEKNMNLSANDQNRFKYMYSKFKSHINSTKEHNSNVNAYQPQNRLANVRKHKSLSSCRIEGTDDFEWPDFERVYDSMPACLVNALAGSGETSPENSAKGSRNRTVSKIDEKCFCSIERMGAFSRCKRGIYFRRNAICKKIDKIVYDDQLNIFLQQLTLENLMRTWT